MRNLAMKTIYVGIDVAKLTFVSAIKFDGKDKVKSFDNNKHGFETYNEWVQTFSSGKHHYCMESTGKYGNDLALFLYNENDVVSIVNPARIKYFMKSQLARNKTDSIDAKHIRHYCELFNPSPWEPLSVELQELQSLVKRVDTLNNTLLQEQNRLEKVEFTVKSSLDNHITYLKNEIKSIEKRINKLINGDTTLKQDAKLLKSIPGVGDKTTNRTLAFLSHIKDFNTAKQVGAFVGLNPQHAQSGTSLNYSHISKTGDAELRKMLYMPALVAIRHEPNIKAFYEKLVGKGKPKKVAICAVMRKLIHIIYGVLKSQKLFDPQLIAVH
jgi:transposase